MASGPITSWQIDGETMETVTDFYFLGFQNRSGWDGDCSHEIKKYLLLGRKAMTNLGKVLKSSDITLPTKVHIVKATVSPVIMYWCESQIVKKTEHWRTDAFKLCCWRLLRGPWKARRSNQSIPKEINPDFIRRTDAEAEAPILWPPDVKNWLTGKEPDARKVWRQEEEIREDEMVGWHHQLKGYEFEQTPGDGEGQGGLACCRPWGHKESDMTERLNNNKGMNLICLLSCEASMLTLHVQWRAKWKNYSYQMVQSNSQVQCKNLE